jgi:hypothetical protein
MEEIQDRNETKKSEVIAVSETELAQFGCPYCGYHECYLQYGVSSGEVALAICTNVNCKKSFVVLANGVKKSSISIKCGEKGAVYPELQPHPRRGISKH